MILITIAIIWASVAAVFVLGLCAAAAKPTPTTAWRPHIATKQPDEPDPDEPDEVDCPRFGMMFYGPPVVSPSGDLVSF